MRTLLGLARRRVSAPRIVAAVGLALWFPTTAHAQSEAVEYYGLDALGSVRVVFDASGNVLGRMDYSPFGQEIAPSNGKQQNIYAGLFADSEAGLYHAGARDNQSRTGRFMTVDPVAGEPADPQSWNRYSYAKSNPLVFTDPSGLMASNCTYKEVTTDAGLSVQVSCTEAGGGGGGGSSSASTGFLGKADWFMGKVLDTLFMAEPVGGNEADLVPIVHRGFKPSAGVETAVDVGLIAVAVAAGKLGGATAAKSTSEELVGAAASAVAKVGPGKGAAYGTRVHTAFREAVEALNLPGVETERSYLGGEVVKWGKPGSVRLDAVLYDAQGNILHIYDLKTGSAVLSPQRINAIMGQLPLGSRPPITVIRP